MMLLGEVAGAQQYPTKPIKLIVPFGAGSTADVIARLIGNSVGAEFGQQFVIENKPGAGGTIGGADAARAPNDGYTLVLGTVASHAVGPLSMQGVTYDPIADFAPITMIADRRHHGRASVGARQQPRRIHRLREERG